MTNNTFFLRPDTSVQMGSVVKRVENLVEGESILTYNKSNNTIELDEILSIKKSEQSLDCQYVKINNFIEAFSSDTIIHIMKEDGVLVYGYFNNEKPVINGIDANDLFEVIPGAYKVFNGSEWSVIESIDMFPYDGVMYELKVVKNHSFFVENVLISDYTK
jgi:intein/homing endonuclease